MQTSSNINLLDGLKFDNRFVNELPADPELENYRRQVYQACYSRVHPKTMQKPRMLLYSREMAAALDLTEEICQSEDFCQIFVGNRLAQGMDPYAINYGGHQFGHWAGQLGDGRAINLGEVINNQGQRWALQLKGAGPTPYSRSADGLAVLRSSLREFLCSEAMHHLGVPTTRALSLILTGEYVMRDMFYDGNPQRELGAVVCRMAPSFTRFGNFQLFTSRDDVDTLKKLVDYTIRTDFPHLGEPSKAVYLKWFENICSSTAKMIVHWQRVGFVHGVMNTDNMSILGLTIDYGPYGWLENYDPDWTPNTTDAQGRRYRFGNQPKIAYWNLVQLANAIYPLIQKADPLQQALNVFTSSFETNWQSMMADKLGLIAFDIASDETLVADLTTLLQLAETDMTLFYRGLANLNVDDEVSVFYALLENVSYAPLNAENQALAGLWFNSYLARLKLDNRSHAERQQIMNRVNPLYVLRNYLAQQAIDLAEQDDFSMAWELLEVLRRPYDFQAGKERFAEKRPDWAKHKAGCSMLSCSS
jgi:protein adenylyltransferase